MKENLSYLKNILREQNLDYFLLPSSDEFLSEYTNRETNKLYQVTGFSGTNGIALIASEEFGNIKSDKSKQKSIFFTDGRYILEAQEHFDLNEFVIFDLSEKTVEKWIFETYKKSFLPINKYKKKIKIGFDANLHSYQFVQKLFDVSIKSYVEFISLDGKFLENGICKKFCRKSNQIFIHPIKYSGRDSMQKRSDICFEMRKDDIDAFIITDPASVCWLLNIRGGDSEYSPIVYCRAILYDDKKMDLFLDLEKLDNKTREWMWDVTCYDLKKFHDKLEEINISKYIKNISLDLQKTNYKIVSLIKPEKLAKSSGVDYCEIYKSVKNSIEIDGAIEAHRKDGVAVIKFLEWIKNYDNPKEISEISAAEKLLEFRKANSGFVSNSFETISAVDSHAAIIHYKASEKTNRNLTKDSLYLIDSGGQYFEGTTDVTRTIAIGEPTEEQKKMFTRVLKGHIALATTEFDEKTTGAELDKIARKYLEEIGLDYAHGTGHGVGSFLSVHEGQYRISKASTATFKPGMIVSIEPGYYKNGEYGIRIENLYLIESNEKDEDSDIFCEVFDDKSIDDEKKKIDLNQYEPCKSKKLKFKVLTLVPIDEKLINFNLLDKKEIEWLNDYNHLIKQNV